MIVYIIPGKTKTIKPAVDYIVDDKKMSKDMAAARSDYLQYAAMAQELSYEDYQIMCNDGIQRALCYAKNENKVSGFVSGYLCHPDFAEIDFARTKEINLERIGRKLSDESGNYFYHIIQSFPEGIDISDEEVHQCGVELVERLGLYQAVVASHIHPVVDEEGEPHGKQKHNHIIINSHIYHEFVDEDTPHKMKYHDCKESYAQLQLINDQIAIEHGLPIIDKPDRDKVYSWYESKEKNKGKSWKARVKIDISNAMRVSEDMDFFIKSMEAAGYEIRMGYSKTHGEYITYTCPKKEHVVRDYILGKGYTIPEMESYWKIRRSINVDIDANKDSGENKIEKLLDTTSEPLFIKFKSNISDRRKGELRGKNINNRKTYTNYHPLVTTKTYSRSDLSYFDPAQTYKIVNAEHQTITEVSGKEIYSYYDLIFEHLQQEKKDEELRRKEEQYRAYFINPRFVKSSNREPYRIGLYDEYGLKRSLIELICILAIVTIKREYEKWHPLELDEEAYLSDPIVAQKDWKIQQMVDTTTLARELNVNDPNDIPEKLNQVGKELSKARADVKRLTTAKDRMEELHQAILGCRELKDLCETIHAMPDSPEKTALQQQHAEEIDEYKQFKAVMYRTKTTSEEAIQDFLERYNEFLAKIQHAEEETAKFSSTYSHLSRLKYNLQLAQNRQYCFGPLYEEHELFDNDDDPLQELESEQETEKPDSLDEQIEKARHQMQEHCDDKRILQEREMLY